VKTLIIILSICTFCLCSFSPVLAREGAIDLKLDGDTLSADLKGAILGDIFEELNKEKGIWWKGDQSVLEEKVTVQFTDLSLEDGMKRILGFLDHCLFFDNDGRLVGVFLGKGGTVREMNKGSRNIIAKVVSSPVKEKNMTPDNVFDKVKSVSPVDRPIQSTVKVLKVPESTAHTQSPGDSPTGTVGQLEGPKVVKNCSTPGGSIQLSAEELENLTVRKNLPSPGGPVNVNEESP
jgi:hypothetical protein